MCSAFGYILEITVDRISVFEPKSHKSDWIFHVFGRKFQKFKNGPSDFHKILGWNQVILAGNWQILNGGGSSDHVVPVHSWNY